MRNCRHIAQAFVVALGAIGSVSTTWAAFSDGPDAQELTSLMGRMVDQGARPDTLTRANSLAALIANELRPTGAAPGGVDTSSKALALRMRYGLAGRGRDACAQFEATRKGEGGLIGEVTLVRDAMACAAQKIAAGKTLKPDELQKILKATDVAALEGALKNLSPAQQDTLLTKLIANAAGGHGGGSLGQEQIASLLQAVTKEIITSDPAVRALASAGSAPGSRDAKDLPTSGLSPKYIDGDELWQRQGSTPVANNASGAQKNDWALASNPTTPVSGGGGSRTLLAMAAPVVSDAPLPTPIPTAELTKHVVTNAMSSGAKPEHTKTVASRSPAMDSSSTPKVSAATPKLAQSTDSNRSKATPDTSGPTLKSNKVLSARHTKEGVSSQGIFDDATAAIKGAHGVDMKRAVSGPAKSTPSAAFVDRAIQDREAASRWDDAMLACEEFKVLQPGVTPEAVDYWKASNVWNALIRNAGIGILTASRMAKENGKTLNVSYVDHYLQGMIPSWQTRRDQLADQRARIADTNPAMVATIDKMDADYRKWQGEHAHGYWQQRDQIDRDACHLNNAGDVARWKSHAQVLLNSSPALKGAGQPNLDVAHLNALQLELCKKVRQQTVIYGGADMEVNDEAIRPTFASPLVTASFRCRDQSNQQSELLKKFETILRPIAHACHVPEADAFAIWSAPSPLQREDWDRLLDRVMLKNVLYSKAPITALQNETRISQLIDADARLAYTRLAGFLGRNKSDGPWNSLAGRDMSCSQVGEVYTLLTKLVTDKYFPGSKEDWQTHDFEYPRPPHPQHGQSTGRIAFSN